MEKKVKIAGKEVVLAYNLATQIRFEERTGRMLDLDKVKTVGDTVQLLLSSIEANNDGTDFTEEDLTKRSSLTEFKKATTALAQCMVAYFQTPKIAEAHVDTVEEEGEPGKNA